MCDISIGLCVFSHCPLLRPVWSFVSLSLAIWLPSRPPHKARPLQCKTAAMPHPCWPAGCWIASAIETFPANYSSSSNESQWQHAKLTHTHRARSSGGVGGDLWQLKIVLETIVTQAFYRSRDSDWSDLADVSDRCQGNCWALRLLPKKSIPSNYCSHFPKCNASLLPPGYQHLRRSYCATRLRLFHICDLSTTAQLAHTAAMSVPLSMRLQWSC